MKKKLGFISVLILTLLSLQPICGAAQGDPEPSAAVEGIHHADVIALQRSYLQLQHQKIVLDNMQLTSNESGVFWPIFRQYQHDSELIGDRLVSLILQFSSKFESMTDEEASAMLKEAQDIQQAENELKRSYVNKFSQILPPRKVLRFYQIDNKLRTEARYALSLEIPLLEVSEDELN